MTLSLCTETVTISSTGSPNLSNSRFDRLSKLNCSLKFKYQPRKHSNKFLKNRSLEHATFVETWHVFHFSLNVFTDLLNSETILFVIKTIFQCGNLLCKRPQSHAEHDRGNRQDLKIRVFHKLFTIQECQYCQLQPCNVILLHPIIHDLIFTNILFYK